MFCVQCEQTISTPSGKGCAFAQGMCGKTAQVSDLQDLLVYALQGTSYYAQKAREFGIVDRAVDAFVAQAFFATLTNVNFEDARIAAYARQAQDYREALRQSYEAACLKAGTAPAEPSPAARCRSKKARALPERHLTRNDDERRRSLGTARAMPMASVTIQAAATSAVIHWPASPRSRLMCRR